MTVLICINVTGQRRRIDTADVRSRAAEASRFCKDNNLNEDFYFLIDLRRHSGLKRFYIWSFITNSIENAFLVSHGCGDSEWAEDNTRNNAVVSNAEGSHLSSTGKYIIGERGYSQWGINIKYLLHGQDRTNSNANRRQIVLHSWEEVPDREVYPRGTPEGWGCPAVSDAAMRIIDRKIRSETNRRVLLWIIR